MSASFESRDMKHGLRPPVETKDIDLNAIADRAATHLLSDYRMVRR